MAFLLACQLSSDATPVSVSAQVARPVRVERASFAWRDEIRRDPLSPDSTAMREYVVYGWKPMRPDNSHPMPLLLFSPGVGVSPLAYDSLLSAVARAGYVVLAVAHTYTTYRVTLPDGRVIRAEDSRVPFNFATHVDILVSDLIATLDYVARHRDANDTRFEDVDLTRVGAFGHSYGGSISAEACHRDRRFKAGLNLDGSVFGNTVTKGVPCPFLLVMADLPWIQRFRDEPRYYPDRDQGRLHEEMMFSRSPRMYWLTVDGLEHMSFTDAAFAPTRAERLVSWVARRLDAPSVRALTTQYVQAFFGHTLRGDGESPVLRRSPYSFAVLRRSQR